MGIDNSAKLIFGFVLEYEQFLNIVRSFSLVELEEDDVEEFYDKNLGVYSKENLFNQKYKGLCLGISSPYYDIELEYKTFYITMGKVGEKMSIGEVKDLLTTHIDTDYKLFLFENGIPYEEPEFISLPHII